MCSNPHRIEWHPVYAVPRGTPLGPGIPLGVAEGLDGEKVRKSTVRVVYGEEPSKMISSGFFVANDKIVTNIHGLADADGLKPDFARAYYNCALVKVLLGQKREAKADFKKARELEADIGK